MTDESPKQQAEGLTEQPIGPQNLVADELADGSQVSTSEYTPEESLEEVTTPELPSEEVSTSEVPSDEVVTPEVSSDEVVAPETSTEDNVDQTEPEVETEPEEEVETEPEEEVETEPMEEVCNVCDPSDPYGLKSDPGCDLPLCKPEPEEPEDDQDTQAEELPPSTKALVEEKGTTQESSLEAQEGEVLEEQEDLEDPCAVPEEPVCDFPKSAPEEKGELSDEELEGQQIVDDSLTGVVEDSSPEGPPENPESDGENPTDQESELEEEVEIVVDPCGPRDPCGFQIDVACIAQQCNDASLQSEIEGEQQVNTDCTNPVDGELPNDVADLQKDSET